MKVGAWAARGSQLQLQLYVNRQPEELTQLVVEAVPELKGREIEWVAPRERAGFAEPRDAAFLHCVECSDLAPQLAAFWPRRGPVWDALAIVRGGDRRGVLLVEGKSHPAEVYGDGTKASPPSRARIEHELAATQRWLGIAEEPARWLDPLRPTEPGHSSVYQTANRYAHLRWLREAGIDAWLIQLLFVHDPTSKPTSRESGRKSYSGSRRTSASAAFECRTPRTSSRRAWTRTSFCPSQRGRVV